MKVILFNFSAFCQMLDGTRMKYSALSKLATEMNCSKNENTL